MPLCSGGSSVLVFVVFLLDLRFTPLKMRVGEKDFFPSGEDPEGEENGFDLLELRRSGNKDCEKIVRKVTPIASPPPECSSFSSSLGLTSPCLSFRDVDKAEAIFMAAALDSRSALLFVEPGVTPSSNWGLIGLGGGST